MIYFLLYLSEIASGLSFTTGLIGFITFIMSMIFIVIYISDDQEISDTQREKYGKYGKKILQVSIITITISILTPSREAIYRITGIGATIDYIENSDEAKKLPDNILHWINAQLDVDDEGKQQQQNE